MVKQVIAVRKDLNMRKGKLAAQVAHASMKVFFDRLTIFDNNYAAKIYDLTPEMKEWIKGIFTKVVVGVENEDEINRLALMAHGNNVPFAVITDAGHTEFHGQPTVTCIAVGPDKEEKIDKITGDLKLL